MWEGKEKNSIYNVSETALNGRQQMNHHHKLNLSLSLILLSLLPHFPFLSLSPPSSSILFDINIYFLVSALGQKTCNLNCTPHPNDHHKMITQPKIKILHRDFWGFFLFQLKLLESPFICSLEPIWNYFPFKAELQLWLFVMVM